ncbi:MAG: blaR1 3 [Planctomycetaceae bacterium]|nr:blaR1 3 [Planctomycetaceae bacterium]
MNPIDVLSPSGQFFPYLIAVVLQVTLWALAALLVVAGLKRSGAAIRHSVLLTGLFAVAIVPVALWIMSATKAKTVDFGDSLTQFGFNEFRLPSGPRTIETDTVVPLHHKSTPPASSAAPAIPSAAPVATSWNPMAPSEQNEVGLALSRCALLLISIWLIGVTVRSVSFLRGLLLARRIMQSAHACDEQCWQDALTDAMGFLKLRLRPRLLTSSTVSSPMVVGFTRPVIVLPIGMQPGEGAESLRSILLHELAHIARRDTLIGLFQRLVDILWWPHPLVARLNQQLSQAREEICDNYVLRSVEKHTYARMLVQLASPAPVPHRLSCTVGLMEPRWPLEARIRGLLDDRRRLDLRSKRVPALAVVLVACLGTFFLAGATATVRTQEDVIEEIRSLGGYVTGLNGEVNGTERVMIQAGWRGKAESLRDLKYIKGLKEIWFSGTTIEEIVLEDLRDLERIIFNVNFYDESQGKQVNWSHLPLKTIRLKNLPKITSFDNRGGGNNLSNTRVTKLEFESMNQLKELHVWGMQLTDDVLRAVAGAPNLEQIDLSRPYGSRFGGRTEISDEGLKSLSGLKKLTVLGLTGAHISDQGVRTIGTLSTLKAVGLTATDVTDAGLAHLSSLKNMISLGVGETAVTDAGLRRIVADHPQLDVLFLGGSAVTADGLKALAGLRHLRMISLDAGQLTEESCNVLSALSIQSLNLTGPSKGAGRLAGLPTIQNMMIEGAENLTVAKGSLTGLKNLWVRGVDQTTLRSIFENLPALKALEQFEISNGWTVTGDIDTAHVLPLDDDLMQQMSHLTALKLLLISARELEIGDRGISALAPLKSLEHVLLPETLVTDEGVTQLAQLMKLQRLRLGGEKITDSSLPHFRQHNELRELTFFNTAVTSQAIGKLKADLPKAVIQANRIDRP